MYRPPPLSPRPDTPFPYTPLFRSRFFALARFPGLQPAGPQRPRPAGAALPAVAARCPHGRRAGGDDAAAGGDERCVVEGLRSEEPTSELQSLMRTSYAVF